MDPRRLEQLDRARKLNANVTVLLARGNEVPNLLELGGVKREHLEGSTRVYVQILHWGDVQRFAIVPIADGISTVIDEKMLADAVDKALDRFEG